jgi:hypothetical protein
VLQKLRLQAAWIGYTHTPKLAEPVLQALILSHPQRALSPRAFQNHLVL